MQFISFRLSVINDIDFPFNFLCRLRTTQFRWLNHPRLVVSNYKDFLYYIHRCIFMKALRKGMGWNKSTYVLLLNQIGNEKLNDKLKLKFHNYKN